MGRKHRQSVRPVTLRLQATEPLSNSGLPALNPLSNRFKNFGHVFFLGTLLVILSLSVGCASRNPVSSRRQPPPEAPSTADETTDSASRSNANPAPLSRSAKRRKSDSQPVPVGYLEEGEASWYGAPFHGRQASDGEIYDMNKLTAAHRTLPFQTMVRVTNQKNGKSTVVRITDRGPFVNNRIIDLSFAAAREIDSVGPGVVPVRLEVLSAGIDPTSGYFTVQVGSFRDRVNAERLRNRMSTSYSPAFVKRYDTANGTFFRVHVGKISGEDSAKELGEQLRAHEGVVPMIIRLDQNDLAARDTN